VGAPLLDFEWEVRNLPYGPHIAALYAVRVLDGCVHIGDRGSVASVGLYFVTARKLLRILEGG
jgi:hypothetical protein